MLRLGIGVFWVALCACGGRTEPYDDAFEGHERPVPTDEICDGLDQDLDGNVDEDWRDELGRYVDDEHCGACTARCVARNPNELAVSCTLIDETPVCAATECAAGFAVSTAGRCIPAWERLCLECATDADCGDIASARCADLGGEPRCAVSCELGCPIGYACNVDGLCAPEGGSCSCDPGDMFDLACALIDPEGNRCPGSAQCSDGTLSECAAPDEVCDEVDNNCDGTIDEGFRDMRGAYSLDVRNCGECGVDCTADMIPEGALVCGGDPFAPSCVLDCPDARDGIMPGDHIDADRDIATGCECLVTSLSDDPGPLRTEGEALDVNCDGADGIIVESFYVAPDGDDTAVGSPTRPLETINEAIRQAFASLSTPDPRPHVFVASGTYTETLELLDGVKLHGGYRRDYLALDPDGFQVVVRAPADTMAPGGAALVAREVGITDTVVEWMSVRGLDATMPSAPAFGAVIVDPGPRLSLRQMEVRSGVAGTGGNGRNGAAGSPPTAEAAVGAPPRAAIEDMSHNCTTGRANTVAGGLGGRNMCDGMEVGGGPGGSPTCPMFAETQPSGGRGRAPTGATGGLGGQGGQDSQGPIMGISCSADVCCGLADFTVPTDFTGPQAGSSGGSGTGGMAGRGCTDAFGQLVGELWMPSTATAGTNGRPGSGGGGGGAGGGAEMDWFTTVCEFADGLGGGGGGGGAGGCGGQLGRPGTSGGPSIAIVVSVTSGRSTLPTFDDVTFAPSDGGRGGDGGGGGDGGLGGTGAFGGTVPRELRSTPTLAGPFPGARGGAGGNGGPGGGGGGGCGGGSVGVWLTGVGRTEPPDAARWRTANTFDLGRGGQAGLGGGGAAAAADGAEGGAIDVVVR